MHQNINRDILVEARNLTVTFDEVSVLEDISFSIVRGCFVGLIGPNGAGKSTLLKALLGLVKPTSGTCIHAPGLTVRYVPQHYVLSSFVPISVSEVVQMGSDERVTAQVIIDALEDVGLEMGCAKKNYHTLSGGQKQRVMIARALIEMPDIIFFDEPLSGVDLETKEQIYAFLKELNQKGVTIFFVSHDVDHIVDACDFVLCLDRSLHQGCHPVAFAQGERIKNTALATSSVCLSEKEVQSHKQVVHHHH